MAITDAAGRGPVHGDDVRIRRTVPNIPPGDTLDRAWFTLKRDARLPDPNAALALSVTSALTTAGQITDTGGSGTGEFYFDIKEANYAGILPDTRYVYDIQVRTTNGVIATLERGWVMFLRDVTRVSA